MIDMHVKTISAAGAVAMALQFLSTGASSATVPDRRLLLGERGRPIVVLTQSSDPRVIRLEEQVRKLNGRIEELNFQLLQMQEQFRRMREDNEFRFQELEDASQGGEPERTGGTQTGEDRRIAENSRTETPGEPPRNFGEIVIGNNESVHGATLGEPMDLRGVEKSTGADETAAAALPVTFDPDELYSDAYEFILSGDYKTAETGFRKHVERFPDDPRSADAHYWLGEAILSQKRPAEAAEVFLAANRNFPGARKAPDMLLKLGMSLAALGRRDIACATFRQVGVRYPDASDILKERVSREQAIAGC